MRAAWLLGLLLAAPTPAAAQAEPPPPLTIGGLTISGFVQADAIVTSGGNAGAGERPDTFAVPRARVGLGGAVTPRITWYLQGEFANLVSDRRVLRDAWLQIAPAPQLAVRAGQMVAPFGLERLTSYSKLELIDRSVAGTSLVPSRDLGVMVFNLTPWRGWLTYAAAVINGSGQNRLDDNAAKDVVGRVAVRVRQAPGLTVGVNAQRGEQPQGERRRWGIDVNHEGPHHRLAVERIAQRRDYGIRIDTTGLCVIGAYKHKARQVTPHYAGYELAARYADVDDDAFALESRRVQAGGTYFVTPQLRVQSNVVVRVGDDRLRESVRWWTRLQLNF
jgi:hypothetical protein